MEITANIADAGLARVEIQKHNISSVRMIGPTDSERPFISPGFVDIQINGFAGVDFSDQNLDAQTAIGVLPAIWKTGVTSFCATLITDTIDRLERSFEILEEARKADTRFDATIPCYHLEGPYLSPGGARGAHNPDLMRPPDWSEFLRLQKAAGGNIAIVTLAPELPGAREFIRFAHAAGVVVAIGHTDGAPEDIHKAIEAGAELSTHLGNGCPQYIHRHQNPVWAQIAAEGLQASLICDGFHLPADLVRTIYKAKGIDRCILVTDAIHAATLPPGRYSLSGLEIELLPSGQVLRSDRESMAGSTLTMNRAIPNFRKLASTSLQEALQAATTNPARLLRHDRVCVKLEPGQPANLVVFRVETHSLHIETVLLRGEQVYAEA
jgi:N-acetylglucosamine-6-phosphate deacetylase